MIWTTTKPTQPGPYWFRHSKAHTPHIVDVSARDCGCLYRDDCVIAKGLPAEQWSSTPITMPEETFYDEVVTVVKTLKALGVEP